MRASFTAVSIAAKMGAEADVPPLVVSAPSATTVMFRLPRGNCLVSAVRYSVIATHPLAATSGYARPVRLKTLGP